jgi:hypothetical protein
MTKKPDGYMSSEDKEYRLSLEHALALFRHPQAQTKEELLQEFMDFVEEGYEMDEDEIGELRSLVTAFLGYDEKKVGQAEKNLLQRWIESCKP